VAKPEDRWRPKGAGLGREQRAQPVGLVDGRCPELRQVEDLMVLGRKRFWPFPEGVGNRSVKEVVTGGTCDCFVECVFGRQRRHALLQLAWGVLGNQGRWGNSQLAKAASTVSSLRVGDVGNGYPTSRWTARIRYGARVPAGFESVAADMAVRAASLRVGDPRSSRDI
jgi:hypothetical protein